MSDIVKRLRDLARVDNCQASLEAADEITRLRAENEKLRAALERIADTDPDEGTQWFHEVARAALQQEPQS